MDSLRDPETWRTGTSHLQKVDSALGAIIEKVGDYKFELEDDHYEALVGAIIFQQLAGKAAQAILNRFKDLYGGKIPTPKSLLRTPESKLRSAGLSPQKISYLRDLSEKLDKKLLDLEQLSELPDEEVIRQLDAVRGIGRWTAEMYLIFVLARPDVLPVDDLGLRKAARRVYGLPDLPGKAEFTELSNQWHPYRTIATLYLWRSGEAAGAPVKW